MPLSRFGQKTAKQVIEQVANNDPKLKSLDLTKNAAFCMNSTKNTIALSEALCKNTVITTVVLRECEIVDAGAEAIAQALEQNSTIVELDLQQNRITTPGIVRLVAGISKNKGLRTLNLLTQAQRVLGEACIEAFISAFEHNITLTKLMWKVDSRRSWELAKLITRNVEIQKFSLAGGDYSHLLPTALRKDATMSRSEPSATAAFDSLVMMPSEAAVAPAAGAPCALAVATAPTSPPKGTGTLETNPVESTSPPKGTGTLETNQVDSQDNLTKEHPDDDVISPWKKQQQAMQDEVKRLQARVQELEEAGAGGGTGNAPSGNDDFESEFERPDSPGGTVGLRIAIE
jgi:hypothetical protein